MAKTSNRFIRDSLEACRKLIVLADEGEAASTDDGCILLYGIIRDCAYRIRGQAERERVLHQLLGQWDEAPQVLAMAQKRERP